MNTTQYIDPYVTHMDQKPTQKKWQKQRKWTKHTKQQQQPHNMPYWERRTGQYFVQFECVCVDEWVCVSVIKLSLSGF